MFEQKERDELKTSKMKIDELQRIDDTHTKYIKFLENIRLDLEQQIANMIADDKMMKNGKQSR